ncbi:MAG: metallophosphoesterase family protein [Oscillospiraceae bacterium]|nr:metallophosphoesterase family protein [Oscillospiraceae bacterium]MDE7170720.1 metallophosphoesterase family protein [Oscillospiraceae bacterium]
MKLLVISDAPDTGLWDYFTKDKLQGADAIISCGDLPSSYLTFLVTVANKPLFYVHGNHDTRYEWEPPEGCDCIDGKIIEFKGYRIMGLGGCMKYNRGAHQYTERQMKRRIAKLRRPMRQGVDILVTHSPAQGLGDMDDPCHRGFACFRDLMDRLRPQYLLHGHVHLQYMPNVPRTHQYGDTTLINASGKCFIELPDRPEKPPKKRRLLGKA